MNDKKKIKVKSLYLFIFIILFILTNTFIGHYIHNLSEDKLGHRIDKSATWHYLCVGLNLDSAGAYWGRGSKSLFYVENREKYDYDTAVKNTKEMLLNDYKKSSIKKIIKNFTNKIIYITQDDVTAARYFNDNYAIDIDRLDDSKKQSFEVINFIDTEISWAFYIIVIIFALIGILINRNNNFYLLYNDVCIFGFALMLLLSEGQSRYKYLIMPFIIVLSSIGINYLFDKEHKK